MIYLIPIENPFFLKLSIYKREEGEEYHGKVSMIRWYIGNDLPSLVAALLGGVMSTIP